MKDAITIFAMIVMAASLLLVFTCTFIVFAGAL